MATHKTVANAVDHVVKKMADEGRLVEAGFLAYMITRWGRGESVEKMPQAQLDELRYAYMSGAQHLFSSIINMLDEGTEETEADLKKMDLIHKELERWTREAARDHMPTKGSA